MSATPESRPVDHTDAATYQPSDYSGVTTADLAEIQVALMTIPCTLQVMALAGRGRRALDRRPYNERLDALQAVHGRAVLREAGVRAFADGRLD